MKKILIIPGGLHMGGAERVAANISTYAPEGEFEFHYLVFEGYENVYGPEIEKRGGKVITVPSPAAGYVAYIRRLSNLIRENHYTAVHSHTMFNSGINLATAKIMGVPVRIAHSHTTRTETKVSLVQKIYEKAMQRLIVWSATDLLACGNEAGEWLFGVRAFSKLGRVIHNGIDSDTFSYSEQNRDCIRQLYGLSRDDFVIGHSGTLLPLKNQEFLIRLLPMIKKEIPTAWLMLLGKGENSERSRLEEVAAECGVSDSVLFCGGVMNVNECLSAMDVFAFPSLREGTPLALIEAQANGLPCIISDRIPDDAILTDLVQMLPLEDVKLWRDMLLSAHRSGSERYPERITVAGYNTRTALIPIYQIYRGIRPKRRAAISLSFDDARGDNTEVFDSVLNHYDLPATLNVTTGYVDDTCPEQLRPSNKASMAIEDIVRFWKRGRIEIAMHGDRHLNTISDIADCREKLNQWLDLPTESRYGFASPGSGMAVAEFRALEFHEFRASVLYMRTSLRIRSKERIRVLCRKAGRVIHLPLLYRIAYADTIMYYRDGKIIYSVPIMRDATLGQVKSIINLCIKNKGSLTLMFHSILSETKGEDNWTWSRSKFEQLCAWLRRKEEEGLVEVLTSSQLFERLD